MIVIPMAGLSSRFKKAGYELPKYMLEAHGETLFAHSVSSFSKYFDQDYFLFIALDGFDTKLFIEQQCLKLGIKHYRIVILNEPTRGQAETVYLGVKQANIDTNKALLIFNIDTFRSNYILPTEFDVNLVDGYLETFVGSGANWSNVLPDDEKRQTVKLTAEKQEISQYCCTGLYYWRNCGDFCRIFETYQQKALSEVQAGEYYIAPMYNDLIDEGKDVRYSVISEDDVIFCGVPDEYQFFLNTNNIEKKTSKRLSMIINYSFKHLLLTFFTLVVIFPTWTQAGQSTSNKTCFSSSNLNKCINSIEKGVINLVPGLYETNGIELKSNITLNIPEGAIIKLSDNARLNSQAFGGVVNAVILAKGTQEKPLKNIHIILNGEIDGNKSIHTYEKGGCEAINLAWIENSSIQGEGIIHSVNGDGIDIDAAKNLVIEGVTLKNNGGSGIHFGSPRPIHGSRDNVVVNVKSYGNGFERERNGLDLSWPNSFGATFVNCYAEDNYRNYEIEARGGVIVNSRSVNTGKVLENDDFSGASYAFINGKDITNTAWVSKKTKILIKRDIKKKLGLDYPGYLDGVKY